MRKVLVSIATVIGLVLSSNVAFADSSFTIIIGIANLYLL